MGCFCRFSETPISRSVYSVRCCPEPTTSESSFSWHISGKHLPAMALKLNKPYAAKSWEPGWDPAQFRKSNSRADSERIHQQEESVSKKG